MATTRTVALCPQTRSEFDGTPSSLLQKRGCTAPTSRIVKRFTTPSREIVPSFFCISESVRGQTGFSGFFPGGSFIGGTHLARVIIQSPARPKARFGNQAASQEGTYPPVPSARPNCCNT